MFEEILSLFTQWFLELKLKKPPYSKAQRWFLFTFSFLIVLLVAVGIYNNL